MGKKSRFISLILGITVLSAPVAWADHQWSSYHWKKDGTNVLHLTVGDNHTAAVPNWPALFADTAVDWNSFGGAYLSVSAVAGGSGDIESYNDNYGNTGWLGLASISVTRGKNKHIVRGSAKANDYYVTLAGYYGFDQPVEWQHVLCQEIGHAFGLDHNREGTTGGTPDDSCMNDETRPLSFPIPNIHDTEQLDLMYAEDHGADGGGGGGGGPKCHPRFGCASIGHAIWAEQYDTENEMFDAADLVIRGTVRGSAAAGFAGSGNAAVPLTHVSVRVADVFKGNARGAVVVQQTRGPGLEIADDPGYVTGDEYTLYLRQIGPRTFRVVNPDGRVRH